MNVKTMIIEYYGFGRIRVNGKDFSCDVIVYGNTVKEWWRKEGHRVCFEDIEEIVKLKPEILIIGTGYYGVVKVDRDVIEKLESQGIKVICQDSRKAVETFNKMIKEGKKVALAIHLTC